MSFKAFHKEESKFSSFQSSLTRNNQVWTKNEEPREKSRLLLSEAFHPIGIHPTDRIELQVTTIRSVSTTTDRIEADVSSIRSVRARYRSDGQLVKVLQDLFYFILPNSRLFFLAF